MNCLLAVLLSTFASFSFAQNIKTIQNKHDHSPVAFATIKIMHSIKGAIANERGEFMLDIQPHDSVIITSVGYKKAVLTGGETGTIIFLEPLVQTLPEIVLRETHSIGIIILGNGKEFLDEKLNCNYPHDICQPWGPTGRKEEFAEKMVLPDSTHFYKLKKFIFPVKKQNSYEPLLFRVYEMDTVTGMPGKEIFVKLISINKKDIRKGKVSVDLVEDGILVNNASSIFLSLAWPPGTNTRENFTAITLFKQGKENAYSRYLHSEEFEWFAFGRPVKEGDIATNTVFTIELEERVYKNPGVKSAH